MTCSQCKSNITNGEWQFCLGCGQKYRSYHVPKETPTEAFLGPFLSKFVSIKAKKGYIISYLTLQNLILLRDILLRDETVWWAFTMTTLGSISMHILICRWILKR